MIIKRTLCALLTFIIVLSVIPGTVWAAESSEAAPENYVQVVKPEEGWGAAGTIELEH